MNLRVTMARSYKHIACWTTSEPSKYVKSRFNRNLRRKLNSNVIPHNIDEDEYNVIYLHGNEYRKMNECYDIHDWICLMPEVRIKYIGSRKRYKDPKSITFTDSTDAKYLRK